LPNKYFLHILNLRISELHKQFIVPNEYQNVVIYGQYHPLKEEKIHQLHRNLISNTSIAQYYNFKHFNSAAV
jgi:hypothetical protein